MARPLPLANGRDGSSEPGLDRRMRSLYVSAERYCVIMAFRAFVPVTVPRLLGDCCSQECLCYLRLSTEDIIATRGGFVNALDESERLRKPVLRCVISFLHARSRVNVMDVGRFVDIDTCIYGKKLCQRKFLDLLCIPDMEFRRILDHFTSGDPFLGPRKGCTGLLEDRTCRALARIGVEASVHGQYNPIDGTLMLGRNAETNHFLRTNAVGARLDRETLRIYVGVTLKRRGVDSFMRCDYCITLNADYKRLDALLRMVNAGNCGRSKRATQYTALLHQHRVISKRKAVLFDLRGCYKNKRTAIAAERGVEPLSIPVDLCVPNEDVETERYCKLLNDIAKKKNDKRKDQKTFGIDVATLHMSEMMDLDEESVDLYLRGFFDEDFSRPSGDGDQDMDDVLAPVGCVFPESDDGDYEVARKNLAVLARAFRQGDDLMNRRRLGLATALERVVSLRKFHNDHVVAERVLTYSAFEMGGRNSLSCLTFAADGVSKEKCKLPNKEKGKNDETVNRLDCFVTGLQMSVPAEVARKLTTAEQNVEHRRRKEAAELRDLIRKKPTDYSDDVKKENDAMMLEFADQDIAAASGYSLHNHDFLYPFGWGGPPKTDALVSNILHVLHSDAVAFAPSCIAIVLDNASVNKNIYTLQSFGLLLELIPRIQEVHLMFPSVGHTHNSVDAHFGALCKRMRTTEIGTPHDLVACMEGLKNTWGHLDFSYYEFASDIEKISGTFKFEFISHQHYFLLYRDKAGDVRFSNKAFLRFADSLSSRVNHLLTQCRELIPIPEDEKNCGAYLFLPGPFGRAQRAELAKCTLPKERDRTFFESNCKELLRQLEIASLATPERKRQLDSLMSPDVQIMESPLSLYDVCTQINAKSPVTSGDVKQEDVATEEEMLLAQNFLMRGRNPRSSDLLNAQRETLLKSNAWVSKYVNGVLLRGDKNGVMRASIVRKLRENSKIPGSTDLDFLIRDLEARQSASRLKTLKEINKAADKKRPLAPVDSEDAPVRTRSVKRMPTRKSEDGIARKQMRASTKATVEESSGVVTRSRSPSPAAGPSTGMTTRQRASLSPRPSSPLAR